MLEIEICGVEFKNPVFLAAGVMGETGGALKRMAKNGAGAVCTKSLGLEKRSGHRNPTIVEVEGGFLNAMGLPNPGVKEYIRELEGIRDYLKKIDVKIIGSIYGRDPEEFSEVAEILEPYVDLLELNISCPHAGGGYGAQIGQDPDLSYKVVSSVRDRVEIPVMVKLTPNVRDIKEIAVAVVDGGADAITAINTLGPGMAIDIKTGRPILGNKFGGMSGKAIKPIALRCVYEIYSVVDVPIVGVGGITTGYDVVEFMMAGATAVQVGTGVYYRGYDIFYKICKELEEYLVENNVKIKDILGRAHEL
ncbi:MAG TPA: dihydroorotate dehydrogenase [Methanothermococcus okinawensis]|uniref:Dihydroorotate dehydrogenase n=1 Tax=Methanothermococcus okinawensis TaxID=155863 RepID=A0A832ZLH0_9EURY|nr:dihydroorotate dehydrogenase [Methanococcaceae archaeon]HIP84143.1 dihydroorotate dehydrogenase [Methanothermococcus okinawensis]HIP91041.1 dihydroorotate dehydrogenase [Methanothermococcus okinawensis]